MFYNYKPISILPVISKIYEKILYEQLALTAFICIALIIITYVSEKNPCFVQFWPQGLYLSVVYDRESEIGVKVVGTRLPSPFTVSPCFALNIKITPSTARVRVATALHFQ